MIEFFLHGYGSSADEFRRWWRSDSTSTAAHFLDGPEFDRFSSRRRWFAFSANPNVLRRGMETAAVAAIHQIECTLKSLGYSSDIPIALVGHSQGAMISFDLLCRQRFNIARVRCFAGYLPECFQVPVESPHASVTAVDIYSSSIDRYIDPDAVVRTAGYFAEIFGFAVCHYQTSSLQHAFSFEWLDPANFKLHERGEHVR